MEANMPTAPDPAKTGQNQDDSPAALTEERVSEIVSAVVNSAVTAQLKRALTKEIGPAIAAAIEPLKAELASSKTKDPPPGDPDPNKVKPSAEIVALQKQVADLMAANKAKDEEAAAARRVSYEKDAQSALIAELTGKVKPGTEKVVATLLKAQGQLVIDDEGAATLKVRTSLARGQAEQDHEFPIAEGVGHYLKTKEADLFRPPPSGAGGGGRPAPGRLGGHQATRGTPTDPLTAFEAQHGPIDDLL